MDVTRRWWKTAGYGGIFVLLGVVAERPVLLFAAAGIGAWLLATAVVSSHMFTRLDAQSTVEYTVSATDTFIDKTTSATLSVSRPPTATTGSLLARATTPPGVSVESGSQTVKLDSGDSENTTTFTAMFSVAGQFEFPPVTISMADPLGLYRTRVQHDPSVTVRVRPRSPDLHVGQAGQGVKSAYGEYQLNQPGPGVTLGEVRQYRPGDDIQEIDWNTTARLAETYVRQTEARTYRRTTLVVDHRNRMAGGPSGETMLDYAREVAIGIARTAAARSDPLELRTVGNDGTTDTIRSATTAQTYTRIESVLYDLESTTGTATREMRSADRAQELADRIETDESAFGSILSAYLCDRSSYVTRLYSDPFVSTVQQVIHESTPADLLIIITNDGDRSTLRESVKIALRDGGHVLVFLTPRCLFERTDTPDLSGSYERYRRFEEFRRTLGDHPRVTAFEIAPGTRLNELLAHRQALETLVE